MPPDRAVDHRRLQAGLACDPVGPLATGDRLNLTFNGSGAALNVQGGPFWALYRVWVDGEPANALPADESGAAYLVLYDPLNELRTVAVARDLAPGEHRLELVAEGGWGQWALQGFQIHAPESPPRNLAGWGLLGLALASTAVWAAYAWDGWRACVRVTVCSMSRRAAGLAVDYGALVVGWRLRAAAARRVSGTGPLLTAPQSSLPLIGRIVLASPGLFGLQFSTLELLTWLGLAGLAARTLLDGLAGHRWPAGPNGLDWPVMAFLAVGLLATLAADHAQVAMREFRTVFLVGGLVYLLVSRANGPDVRLSRRGPYWTG
jgi:hypothetical protein